MEIWKDVIGYEGMYGVSDFGRVMRIRTGRILKHNLIYGYPNVALSKNGKMRSKKIHTLVTESFIDSNYRSRKLVVNHKDFNKENNHLSNLEIITQRENSNKKHITSSSKYTGVYFKQDKWSSQILASGKRIYLGVFESEKEAFQYYEAALKCVSEGRPQEIIRKAISYKKRHSA